MTILPKKARSWGGERLYKVFDLPTNSLLVSFNHQCGGDEQLDMEKKKTVFVCELPLTYRVLSGMPRRPGKHHRRLSAPWPGCTGSHHWLPGTGKRGADT